MSVITLETDYPVVAIDSPDHIAYAGTVVDNRTEENYVRNIKEYFGENLKVLDLGCAGGQMITDFNMMRGMWLWVLKDLLMFFMVVLITGRSITTRTYSMLTFKTFSTERGWGRP